MDLASGDFGGDIGTRYQFEAWVHRLREKLSFLVQVLSALCNFDF